jgi:hypothetical protein
MQSQDSLQPIQTPKPEYRSSKLMHGKNLMAMEYEQLRQRVKKGAELLKGNFLNPEYEEKVNLYNDLANQMLQYEIENNLLNL